ncbi:MAG: hypothetical protein ACK4UP_00270 [Spirosomataceae bacterium]
MLHPSNFFAILILTAFGLFSPKLEAQVAPVYGKFIDDSLFIGKPIYYSLTYKHAPNEDVFFPDESYSIPPFEIINRTFFPTRTQNNVSTDSIVYTLVTFDISPYHDLSMPVFSRKPTGDSLAIYSKNDRIYTHTYFPKATGLSSFSLKKYPVIENLPKDFNLFGFLRGVVILLAIAFFIYAFMGKRIRIQYHLFLFSRKNKVFTNSFKKQTKDFTNTDNIVKSLVLWKEYMEWLEKKPYTSFTTKEIFQEIPNQRLLDALQEIDSSIYGGNKSNHIPFALSILLNTTQEKYKEHYILFLDWLKQNK